MDISRSFFRIITPSLNHNIQLILPTSFVNDWKQQLCDAIQVTAYDGIIIVTIKLEIVDGKIYLADGWEQFFDHHNLQDGYVLVFEYNGNFKLNMTIFDHFGLEVTYDSDEKGQEGNTSDNPIFEITLTPRLNRSDPRFSAIVEICAQHSDPRFSASKLGHYHKFKTKWRNKMSHYRLG
ncbi:B3 domain-containing transcription factor VRN1-like [Olea europaea var. sylvestris]|uniref:B3 domain-containing transcription factor VRN1-like n=1 Tax=Olea europaea var. sylvestris TaxID=158386 RepID=UPI000C1CCD99|nr:B3 domain-containing transcription factor VRN1-like [Olea europaea var. sylvestris]